MLNCMLFIMNPVYFSHFYCFYCMFIVAVILSQVYLLFSRRAFERHKMPKDGKPKGKLTAYTCFVQTCRDEHKKKNPSEPLVLADFSKKCGEKWKVPCTFCRTSFSCVKTLGFCLLCNACWCF